MMSLATLEHKGKVLNFRTNPNKIRWSYELKTKVDETYGGRVIQILSTSIGDLTVTADAGRGSWPYMRQTAEFFRDMLFDQREGGLPGTFTYPGRGWEMKVYALQFPYRDKWDDVRREFTMQFKVQEDVSGIISSNTIALELAKIKKGIGYSHNEYNTPEMNEKPASTDGTEGGLAGLVGDGGGLVQGVLGGIDLGGLAAGALGNLGGF
jgi:hypothetical protein